MLEAILFPSIYNDVTLIDEDFNGEYGNASFNRDDEREE